MNDFANTIGDFISLRFKAVVRENQKGSLSSFASLFSGDSSVSTHQLGEAIWQWPGTAEELAALARTTSSKNCKERAVRLPCEYDCVPAAPLLEVFLAQEGEIHKKIFGAKLITQYRAMREILLAGDANRLVAELTFVRINDLAAPPEPLQPIMYLEPFVAILIVANGVMIGFQSDPSYQDWPGWIYVEIAFAVCLVMEICVRCYVMRCKEYCCGSDRWWNRFDLFLMMTGLSDILIQVTGNAQSNLAATSLLRFCRLIRLIRIVKLFRVKIMQDLRIMVKGLVAGLRTLALSFILLFTVIYVIAGFATMTIGSSEQTVRIGLDGYFSNLPIAMFTAFRCFTGECVTDLGQPIHSLLAHEFGLPFLAGYVGSYMLVSMGIFNLILAVYVDITMRAAKENDVMTAEQHARESVRVARIARELLKIFSNAYHAFQDHAEDAPDSNTLHKIIDNAPRTATLLEEGMHDKVEISKELFLLVVQDRHVQRLMNELDLPPDRANLFEMLDTDGSGTLQTTELLQGLLKIRGEVNKSDTLASLLAIKAVLGLVTNMRDEHGKQFNSLREELALCQWYMSKNMQALVPESPENMRHALPGRGVLDVNRLQPPSKPEAVMEDVDPGIPEHLL